MPSRTPPIVAAAKTIDFSCAEGHRAASLTGQFAGFKRERMVSNRR